MRCQEYGETNQELLDKLSVILKQRQAYSGDCNDDRTIAAERFLRLIREQGAAGTYRSSESRAETYSKAVKALFVSGIIVSVVLAMSTGLSAIPFSYFTMILIASRLADILSTVFALQVPGMIETNPGSDPHRLSSGFLMTNVLYCLKWIGLGMLLSMWSPTLGRITMLTYSISSFAVTISNLYQAVAMSRVSTFFHVTSSGIVGFCVFNLLKVLK